MHLEELIATLIATLKTNTSSLDENNRLLRATAAGAPAEPTAPKPRKPKAEPAPEPEPTPEPAAPEPAAPEPAAPEPEPPTLDAPDDMDEPEEDTTDYLELSRKTVMDYRKANPDKSPANKAAYTKILLDFKVDKLADVPRDKSKDFYLAVKAIC